MSRFFVGQRVRVVMPESTMHGDETRVIAVGVKGWGRAEGAYIGNQVERTPRTISRVAIFEDHELEPILPEGAAPSEFQTLHDLLTSLEGVAA